MDKVIDAFKNRSGKSLGSLIVMIIGIVTIFGYQEIRIANVKDFSNIIINSKDSSVMMWTWGINLVSLVLNIVMVWLWLKDILKDNNLDMDSTIGRVVSLLIAVIHVVFSFIFIGYIFSNLLGIVMVILIISVLVWVLLLRNRGKKKVSQKNSNQ
ncbi:hypothetical protein [Bacillus cereus group sp. RP43]|uniref:hypothetical protein n=1 Tax=Bacillus cereus group sp. RP43 TaxID=3040260 RepID=UPI003399FFDC